MTERFIVDDAGTLIDMQTRDMFDIVEEVVDLLNEQHETIQRLKQNIIELLSVNVEEDLLKENEQLKQQKQQYKGQRDYLLFVIERTCSKELFEETKSYLKEVE